MNKAELVNAIASKAEITQTEANKVLNAVLETITETLKKEESIVLVGFGTFEVKARAARVARNLRTGEPMTIPAKKVPSFRAGKGLKEAVNQAKKPAAKKGKK
ncbi:MULTISPECIES: HU family DNA-binding protein [Entomomonas]|uniref:HU family DNA-binding protein n=1 Tax=Entomomonas asaccharolytica TaxID=2785331 RepID=A0A974RXX8_9GAMM|nr:MULTISPECIES: HU family DNA-binding protein [Entomomonas]QQP86602.1 HU family DNA-binding protein [Entomomonas asaccharolytica]UYZ83812.1 HU family DNA-binding protein [Entomomonas sp. E2T0]